MATKALSPKAEKAKMQAKFAKDKSFMMMFICFLLALICAGLAASLYFIWYTRPTETYFGVTSDAKLFEMEPLSRPYLNEKQLNQWVVEAAVSAYTFDFVNYEKDIESSRVYFTKNGFAMYIAALKASGTVEDMVLKSLVTSAVPTGAPVITKEGRNPSTGRYNWTVQLPLLVTYRGATDIINDNLYVTVIVSRVPVEEKPKGIGIETITVRKGKQQQR